MIGYKFESAHEYHMWCADVVNKIYYAGLCMNNERLKEITSEVLRSCTLSEGYDLIKIDGTEYEEMKNET
jgi:hypothetical protein